MIPVNRIRETEGQSNDITRWYGDPWVPKMGHWVRSVTPLERRSTAFRGSVGGFVRALFLPMGQGDGFVRALPAVPPVVGGFVFAPAGALNRARWLRSRASALRRRVG